MASSSSYLETGPQPDINVMICYPEEPVYSFNANKDDGTNTGGWANLPERCPWATLPVSGPLTVDAMAQVQQHQLEMRLDRYLSARNPPLDAGSMAVLFRLDLHDTVFALDRLHQAQMQPGIHIRNESAYLVNICKYHFPICTAPLTQEEKEDSAEAFGCNVKDVIG